MRGPPEHHSRLAYSCRLTYLYWLLYRCGCQPQAELFSWSASKAVVPVALVSHAAAMLARLNCADSI